MGRLLAGFLWKDAKLFMADRQALVMAFVVPALIATILSWLDSSAVSAVQNRQPFYLVDLDGSEVSRALVARLQKSDSVAPQTVTEAEAQQAVRLGKMPGAAIIPKGFGPQAKGALSGGSKGKLQLLLDPTKLTEGQVIHGVLMGEAAAAAAEVTYGALGTLSATPVEVDDVQASPTRAPWSASAHDYAGFGIQGLLFFAIESAIGLAKERRLGIWRRLRSTPVPPSTFLFAKGVSTAVLSFGVLVAIFAIGALLFGIRILGSGLGFGLVLLTTALMASTFGLAISNLGKKESQSRGLSILLIFVMLATGGAWFPMSQMPGWVQSLANFLPVRWAVEGLDATTWRGLSLSQVMPNIEALLAFTLVYGVLALFLFRFRSETV